MDGEEECWPVKSTRLIAPPRPPSRHTCGFTLLELLTVIGIIGILVALLLPLLGNMRARAKAAECRANLHQMGAAFQIYVADNQGFLPAVSKHATADTSKGTVNKLGHWQVEISPYFGRKMNQNVQADTNVADYQAQCPEFTISSASVVSRGYGMNDRLTSRGKVQPLTDSGGWSNYSYNFRVHAAEIEDPARTILVADNDGLGGDSAFVARHQDKVNCLFVDGHVAAYTLQEASALKAAVPAN